MANTEKLNTQQELSENGNLGSLATLESFEDPKLEILTSDFFGGVRKRMMWAGGNDGFGQIEVHDLKEGKAYVIPVDNREDAIQVYNRPLLNEEKGIPIEMLESYDNFDGMSN